jgi:hypothetical protein
MVRVLEKREDGKYPVLDLAVMALAVFLVVFLLVTMGIRTHADQLESECQARLLALATAQQLHLVKYTRFTADLEDLRPFLEPGRERMPMVCPLSGRPFEARVQGDRYKIIAPGTNFTIETGDPSW